MSSILVYRTPQSLIYVEGKTDYQEAIEIAKKNLPELAGVDSSRIHFAVFFCEGEVYWNVSRVGPCLISPDAWSTLLSDAIHAFSVIHVVVTRKSGELLNAIEQPAYDIPEGNRYTTVIPSLDSSHAKGPSVLTLKLKSSSLEERQAYVDRSPKYSDALKHARSAFPELQGIDEDRISFSIESSSGDCNEGDTKFTAGYQTAVLVTISPGVWSAIISALKGCTTINVVVRDEPKESAVCPPPLVEDIVQPPAYSEATLEPPRSEGERRGSRSPSPIGRFFDRLAGHRTK